MLSNLFIGLKAKLYAVGVAVVSALIIAAYWLGRRDTAEIRDASEAKKRLDDARKAEEIEDDVESRDDDALRDSASDWVRKNND